MPPTPRTSASARATSSTSPRRGNIQVRARIGGIRPGGVFVTFHYEASRELDRLHSELFRGARSGGVGLLRDLQDLYLMAAECDIC